MAKILRGGRFGEPREGDGNEPTEHGDNPKGELEVGNFGQPLKKEKLPMATVKVDTHKSGVLIDPENVSAIQRGLEAAKHGDLNGQELAKLFGMIVKIKDMEAYLVELKGPRPSRATLAAGEQYWKSKSTDELLSEIEQSSESHWQKAAGTYMALVDQYHNRIKNLLENFKK